MSAAIALRQGPLEVNVQFSLIAPWTCLFGPSGGGKSTILRTIAGLVQPDGGRIAVRTERNGEDVLFDDTLHISKRPDRRAVRMAGQQAWLFPGTVRKNLGYGMAAQRLSYLAEVAERFRLGHLVDADVRDLSGGERQRVSLGRAVAATMHGKKRVRLLLLDEPFAGMDTALRDRLAVEVRDLLAGSHIPVLSVTHDVAETFLLGAEVIRVAEGKIVAQGPVGEVLAEERLRLRAVLGHEI